MDKKIWKLRWKWPYFIDNILVGVRIVFLHDYPLVLSILKHKGVKVFFNRKNEDPKQEKPFKQ